MHTLSHLTVRTTGSFLLVLLGLLMASLRVSGDQEEPTLPTADTIVDRMIEAHGGMATWKNAPTISFTDEFRPGDAEAGMPSHVTVEQGRRRATIDYPDPHMALTWDGERCWTVNWQLPTPPRFLALLNYYFLDLPWLTKDDGVLLGEPGFEVLPGEDARTISIQMGFEAGTGDTPDDYFVLLIDPETYRLRGCRYIVTYKDALPEGVEASPEHLLLYDSFVDVEGLLLPSHYTIYDLDHAVYATCEVRDWSLRKPFDEVRMQMPDGAVVDTSSPR
jgi:hypothetical protein